VNVNETESSANSPTRCCAGAIQQFGRQAPQADMSGFPESILPKSDGADQQPHNPDDLAATVVRHGAGRASLPDRLHRRGPLPAVFGLQCQKSSIATVRSVTDVFFDDPWHEFV
jgi:hypothetical protein